MGLPANADLVVFRGRLLDELTGGGVPNAVVTYAPIPLPSQEAPPLLRDLTAHAHIQTRQRNAPVNVTTGYHAAIVLSSDDPDLDAYGGRRVTIPGTDPYVVAVPYNSPLVPIDEEMAAALPELATKYSLDVGDDVRAVWLVEAPGYTAPPPPSESYYTAVAVNGLLADTIDDHDTDAEAHPDIRALIGGGGGGGGQPADSDLTAIAALDSTASGAIASDGSGWIRKTYTQLKTALSLVKADVGLGNVDNTADTAKPVSTTQQTALDGKAAKSANLSDLASATAARTNLGLAAVAASGSASDLTTGTLPQSVIPAIALTDFLGAVANQAAMLALTGQKGDWATRTDLGTDWQIVGADPTQLASWREHVYPASPVQSVNGRTGAVTGLAEQTALTAHTGATTNPHAVTKTQVGLGNVDNTADTAKPVSTAQQTALDAKAYAPPRVVDFARQAGVDPTGTTACDTALDTALALGTESSPIVLHLRPGDTYRLDTAHTVNPRAVSIVCPTGRATLDCRNMTTGPALTIGRTGGPLTTTRVALADIDILGPTSTSTTVDGIKVGGTGIYANLLRFEQVRLLNFRDQWLLSDNCYLDYWSQCLMDNAARWGVYVPSGIVNGHENQVWVQCIFKENKGGSVYCAWQGATLHFYSCSFDYAELDFEIHSGHCMLTDCYIEASNAVVTAATERIRLVPDNEFGGATFKMKGGSIWPFWAVAGGTTTSFIRITGDTSAIRTNAAVSLDGTVIRTDSTATVRYLIRDDRTPYAAASSDSTADKYSRVNVRDLTYKDFGGGYGAYHPLIYRDVDGREYQLDGGVDHGMVGDHRNTPSAWTHRTSRLFDTMPRVLATGRLILVTGDLYMVALPKDAPGWVASAWEFLCALATQGSSISYARLGIYSGPRNYDATTVTASLLSSQGFAANTTSNVLVVTGAAGTLRLGDRNRSYYLAMLVTSTGTMPQFWGRPVDTNTNPLLDPQSTSFTRVVGKLTAQTALPSTIDLTTLVNVNFIPWLGIRPTTYA